MCDATNPELKKIDAILDKTVRSYLQAHGGNLKLVSLEGNTLKIKYQGACGGCPSATFGTLQAIEGALKEEYNPNIVVQAV